MLADTWIWLSPRLSSSAPETETSKSYSWIETCYSVISLLGSWRETDGSYIKARVHRCLLLRHIMQKSNKINKCIKRKEKNMTMNSPGVCSSAAELCRAQSAPWRLWISLHFSCARVRAAAAAHMASRSLFIVCWVSRTEGTVPRPLTAARVWTHHGSSCRHTLLL